MKTDDRPSQPTGGLVDNSKLFELESLVRDVKREQQTISIQVTSIQNEMKDKVDNMMFNLNISKKIDRDEVLKLVDGQGDDKLKKLQRDLEDLIKKFDALNDSVEKRMAKLRKEFDMISLQKLIKSKADTDQVKKDLDGVEGKLASLADLLQTLKKDYENVHSSFKRMNQYFLFMQSGSTDTALLSTRACLSCGKGDAHFVPPVHTVTHSIVDAHGSR